MKFKSIWAHPSIFILLAILLSLFSCKSEKEKATEIIWDKWGVPHIYAQNDSSAFFAEGWAQMHNHGNLILELYGRSRGKSAEYWGENRLDDDILLHTLGFPEIAKKWAETQYPETKELIQSFVNGMNAYAQTNPNAFAEENKVVLPIQYDDVNLHALYVIYTKFVGGQELGTVDNWNEIGSNAYAVGSSRSASGNAMLVQNPHLPWFGEFLFTEMHLNTPTNNVYGATIVGIPGIVIGFNENLGWSHTNNTIDNTDIYELDLDADGYLLDGKHKEFKKTLKTIKYKNKDGEIVDKEIEILQSEHGPILKKGANNALAIRMPGFDRSDVFLQWKKMSNANNFDEFESALKTLQIPFFNVMYADKDGNIFHLFNGLVPERKAGDWNYWSNIIKGGKSEDIWTSVHPYSDLPKVKNPQTGFLQNANDPAWFDTYPPVLNADDFPAYFSPRKLPFRPQRSIRMLLEDESITYDELVDYKLSTRMEMADRILDDLFNAIDLYGNDLAKEAKTVLENWDRMADNNSMGTLLFTEWALQMKPWFQDMYKIKWDEKNPLSTPDGLIEPKNAVKVLEKVAANIKEKNGSLSVEWGDVNRINYNNIDLPGNGANGVFGTFRTTWSKKGENDINYIYGGDSWVGIIEFGDIVKANVLLSYGNSTQKDSPNNGDQLKLFSEKKLRQALFYRQDVMDNAKTIQIFSNDKFIHKNLNDE
ncbi:MAG: acylase [Bacteroidota bacterium]